MTPSPIPFSNSHKPLTSSYLHYKLVPVEYEIHFLVKIKETRKDPTHTSLQVKKVILKWLNSQYTLFEMILQLLDSLHMDISMFGTLFDQVYSALDHMQYQVCLKSMKMFMNRKVF